jgi:hypothetical protein
MRISLLIAALAVLPLGAQTPSPQRTAPSGFPLGPASHIDSFTAEPASIQPGQSTTLRWAVVNSDDTSIDNGIGVVPARGSRKVTPKVTTTYTFAASGRGGSDKRSVTVTVAGTTPAAQPTHAGNQPKAIPRMSDGKPDLSGVYIGGFDVRPIDKIEIKPGAEKYKMTAKEQELGPGVLCVPPGIPAATMQPYPLQIVQKPGLVVILYEAYHLFRVIPTDGRAHPDDLDPTWMGNSVGHWEGDTLVVDVTGFNNKTDIAGYHHTTSYHVVERYRRPDFGHISYEATISDPNVFAQPWRYAGPLKLHPEWDLQEYVCEENNKDYKELFENK